MLLSDWTRLMNERLWAKVDATGDCWEWTASKDQDGYGLFHLPSPRRTRRAHRVVWEELIGPIPDGMVVDHWCKNPSCVNPDHLNLTTQRMNVLRGVSTGARAIRTNQCIHGHSLADAYTWNGKRKCRTCHRLRQRKGLEDDDES